MIKISQLGYPKVQVDIGPISNYIAVSSFGESLRRVSPHRPGGGDF
jgi:hypothetical protein